MRGGAISRSDEAAADPEPTIRIPCIGKSVPFRYLTLVFLVAQTVGAIITMRLSRIRAHPEDVLYLNTTAVVMAEVFKLLGSVILTCKDAGWSMSTTIHQIHSMIIQRPFETIKVGVPALLYTLQTNLLLIALSNMGPAMYQVTYQLKILTTAVLTVAILNRMLSIGRWIALVLLTTGVIFIQLPTPAHQAAAPPPLATTETPLSPTLAILTPPKGDGDLFVGFVSVIIACLTSGFAGVYFEKILKGSRVTIWIRNIQLALFGTILGLAGVWLNDGGIVRRDGFFRGYTFMTWTVILLQGLGGLIVAAVLKYADNILKCFGNAVATVVCCIVSYGLLQDFELTPFFFIGTTLVVASAYAYGVDFSPTPPQSVVRAWRSLQSATGAATAWLVTRIRPPGLGGAKHHDPDGERVPMIVLTPSNSKESVSPEIPVDADEILANVTTSAVTHESIQMPNDGFAKRVPKRSSAVLYVSIHLQPTTIPTTSPRHRLSPHQSLTEQC